MKKDYFTSIEADFTTAEFDRMAKSQGVYSMTSGFNYSDTQNYLLASLR